MCLGCGMATSIQKEGKHTQTDRKNTPYRNTASFQQMAQSYYSTTLFTIPCGPSVLSKSRLAQHLCLL